MSLREGSLVRHVDGEWGILYQDRRRFGRWTIFWCDGCEFDGFSCEADAVRYLTSSNSAHVVVL